MEVTFADGSGCGGAVQWAAGVANHDLGWSIPLISELWVGDGGAMSRSGSCGSGMGLNHGGFECFSGVAIWWKCLEHEAAA
ncbi:hypothetical protein FCV25MIE_16702 [Fagus crenata]